MYFRWWCTSRIEGIIVSSIPSTYFVFISLDVFLISFIKFLITSNAFYVVLTPLTHGDFIAYVSLLGSMGYGQGSHLPLLLACFQSMALLWYWKNQRCGSAGWNPSRPSWCDVHVHQSWRNNWWLQRAWEGCCERKPS